MCIYCLSPRKNMEGSSDQRQGVWNHRSYHPAARPGNHHLVALLIHQLEKITSSSASLLVCWLWAG